MAGNLGTLWFGADIDLTALKQKIQSGNQSILDALKLNYDQQSYQQMVSKLRSQLLRETFEIKLTANTQNIVSNLQNAAKNGTFRNTGIDDLNEKIRDQTLYVNQLEARLRSLAVTYSQLKSKGQLLQASNYKSQMADISRELIGEKRQLRDFMAERAAMRNSSNDALLQLKRERAERRALGEEERRSVAQRRKEVNQLTSDHLRLNTTIAGGIHVSTQLGSALSSVFAIHAARQFLDNVIEIGGQLEKQRISIAAILGDALKATHLFEQIKDLALKSPFGVVELDQYTKQLAAYGFKQNELFDMTKRLADISAGAGQDIGRLTLALGHVRSATYLTGITLRQFSMNNIPMLKMLADYYSEVEKKAVSTADVQKRISKRQVSYQDVIEQIRRLTDEGGMFYNMQEKISESLAAKYKNLKDALDIMYGEIAESNIGDAMKNTAEVLLKTTRHWKEIAAAVSIAAAAFLVGKMRIGVETLALQGNTAATLKNISASKQITANKLKAASAYRSLTNQERIQIASSNSLTAADLRLAMADKTLNKEDVLRLVALKKIKIAQAMHLVGVNGITAAEIKAAAATKAWRAQLAGIGMSLKNAFRGVGAGTWTTLAMMVGAELYMAWDQWNSRIDEKANEMKDLAKSHITDLQKMQKSILTNGKPKDNASMKNTITEMKQVLANSEAYTKTLDEQLSKTSSLPKQYEILAGAINDAVEENKKMLDVQDRAAELIKASKSDFSWWDVTKIGLISPAATKRVWDQKFNDDIKTNIEDVNNAYKSLRKTLDSLYEYKEPLKELIDSIKNSDISEDLKEQLEKAPFEEQLRLLIENGYWEQIEDKIKNVGKRFGDSEADVKRVCERLKKSFKGVADEWGEIADDDIPKMYKKMLAEFDGDEKKLREWVTANIDDFKMLMEGILDQIDVKEPAIRRKLKGLALDYVMFSDLIEKGDNSVTAGQYQHAYQALTKTFGLSEDVRKKYFEEKEKADLDDDDSGAKNDKKGKDKELEAARTKLEQYKAFLSEYKKFREMYSKEAAITKLESLFPDLKDEKGKFLGGKLVDNYIEMLDKLKASLKLTTEARKKWANDVDKTKSDTTFDREKEAMKENADAMQEYMKRIENQWKQYRSLLQKSGGNRNVASMAFNDKGEIWDETAKKMLERFNQRGNELGVVPIKFRWDMSEKELKDALVDSKGQIQEELVKAALEIQSVIRGNYVQFVEDVASAYEKSLTEAQKLVELERQRQELLDKKANDNDQSPEQQAKHDILIAAMDNEIAKQRWAAFKDTDEWVRIFGNLDKVSKQSLVSMREQLLDVLPSIRENVEATKALYEALEKLDSAINDRNPFKAMGDALKKNSAIKGLLGSLKGSKDDDDVYISKATAKATGIKAGKQKAGDVKKQGKDEQRGSMIDFNEGLQSLVNKFNDCANAIEPVIQMFDALGMSGVGEVFSGLQGAMSGAATGGAAFKALGITGPWGAIAGAGLSVVSSIVTGLVKSHDEALEEEIQASKQRVKLIDNLSKTFEQALERVLGGVYGYKDNDNTKGFNARAKDYTKNYEAMQLFEKKYGTSMWHDMAKAKWGWVSDKTYEDITKAQQSGEYYDQQRALLMMQRDETAKQLRDEQSKKDSDGNAIDEYKQQIEELNEEIKNFALDMAKNLYDIDLKSWAQEFGDAIVTAWENGEKASEAYGKSVKSTMKKLAKTLLQQKIMEAAFKASGIEDMIVNMMDVSSGKLDYENIVQLATAFQGFTEGVTESYTAVLDELYKRGVIDKGESNGGLSSTIQGITESTADLLASYINAMRLDLSVNRNMIAQYYPQFLGALSQGNTIANAQLTQLQMVVANTNRNANAAQDIYDILHAVMLGQKSLKTKV